MFKRRLNGTLVSGLLCLTASLAWAQGGLSSGGKCWVEGESTLPQPITWDHAPLLGKNTATFMPRDGQPISGKVVYTWPDEGRFQITLRFPGQLDYIDRIEVTLWQWGNTDTFRLSTVYFTDVDGEMFVRGNNGYNNYTCVPTR